MMHAFRTIFSHPGTVAMSAAAFVGRFPMAMLGLAVTMLVVAETGSYAAAGAVAAALTLAGAVGGPWGARLADRHGQHRVIPPLLAAHISAIVALTIAVMSGSPRWSWLVLAAIAGLCGPNLGAMVRSRWARIVDGPDELGTAFAFESTIDEVAFVLGPPLATALAVMVAAWSAIAAGILLAAAGGLALAAQRRTEPPATPLRTDRGRPVWRSGTLQLLTGAMVLVGAVFGALEVGTVAFAREHGAVTATGLLLGVFALSSGLTGFYLGARPGSWRLSVQLLTGAAMMALATAFLPAVGSVTGYGVGMFAAGLGVSAVMIAVMQLIERVIAPSRLTEALAVAIAGVLVGSAAAVALAGALIDRYGAGAGIAVASVSAVGATLVVLLARPHLRRVEQRSPDPDAAIVSDETPAVTDAPVAVPEG